MVNVFSSKTLRKWLLPVLCLVLAVCLAACGETEDLVYVDAVNGSDANNGLREDTAVATLEGAYDALYAKLGSKNDADAMVTIVLLSDLEVEAAQTVLRPGTVTEHAYQVVITGKSPETTLRFRTDKSGAYQFIGPTTFEHITLLAEAGEVCLNGSGSLLKIGQGVSTGENGGLSLAAGPLGSYTGDAALEVNSGNWKNVYAGSCAGEMTGNASLVMNGGSCQVLGTTYTGKLTGNSSITVNDGTVEQIQGGVIWRGSVTGDVAVMLNGGTVNGAIFVADAEGVEGTASLHLGAEAGKTLSLLADGLITADRFTGGGTLVLGGNTQLQISGTVTGQTQCVLQGDVRKNYTYITAAEGFSFLPETGIVRNEAVNAWMCMDEGSLKGLVLQVPEDVSLQLRTDFTDGRLVESSFIAVEDGTASHYYLDLPAGNYSCEASGEGYYNVIKNIWFSEEKAAVKTVVNADPGKKSNQGFEPESLQIYTDEVLEKVIPSDPSLWPQYADAFTTPYFTAEGQGRHQATTQQQMMDYIAELDGPADGMYVYSLIKSPTYQHEIPLIVYTATDLSGTADWEQAAELIRDNGKITIYYQGQIHGNEPAGGEGTLAVLKWIQSQPALLETVNLVVIPRLNVDGSQNYTRVNANDGIDMNRDLMTVQSQEIAALHRMVQAFAPEMFIDAHEASSKKTLRLGEINDMQIGAGYTLNTGAAFNTFSENLARVPFAALEAAGLRTVYYDNQINVVNATKGRGYWGNQGIISILLESPGIGCGMAAYERRVVAQYIAATELLQYASQNAQQIQSICDGEKQRIAECGMTYEEADQFVLQTKSSGHPEWNHGLSSFNLQNGELMEARQGTPGIYDIAVASRTRPTAYVIPAGESWTQTVLELLDQQGISYQSIPAGKQVYLQQYTGTFSRAMLTEESLVSFPEGAYVICMNQAQGNNIAMLMEPDMEDVAANKATLAQAGIIKAEDGKFPIYRYIRDLNDSGMIDMQ